jgi:dTMP kinase
MAAFITLEGPDGSGKTGQAEALSDFLREHGLDVLLTREPGGTPIGDKIRKVLADLENAAMLPQTEFLLFSASRAQLVEEVIRPNLQAGRWVISDRFFDSSLAYQGFGHKLDLDKLLTITRFATGGLEPDLTLLLDLPAEEGLERRQKGGSWNRLDAYDVDFHRRARAGYLKLAKSEPARWAVIDASESFERVQQAIQEIVSARLDVSATS